MSERKPPEELTILEAVDNLSSLAELEGGAEGEKQWLDPEKLESNRTTVKETFRVLHKYLQHVYQKDKGRLREPDTQRGIQAIMVLAGEAAQKLDKFTSLFRGTHRKESVTGLKEYKDLQQFYLTKIMKRFQEVLEAEEAWQAEWGEEKPGGSLDIERRGLKDLETVRRDKEYELFYIRKEDGRPFFNKNLLRHIKLIGDFDAAMSDLQGEDPFLKIQIIHDRDLHEAAREILNLAAPYIDEFYREGMKHKDAEFVAEIHKALMALMLTANPRNLLQSTIGKSCFSYYRDFHFFLRRALSSSAYSESVNLSWEELDSFSHVLMNLSQALCCFFFMHTASRKDDLDFIHRLIHQGQQGPKAVAGGSRLSFWNTLLDEDQHIRYLLKHYPNGPLFKALDVLREGGHMEGFDPLSQNNFPCQLYRFKEEKNDVTVLRVPAPIRQTHIQHAEVVEEFRGFLRFLASKMGGAKYLMINFEDRTSWQGHARSETIEGMQNETEFSEQLFIVSLPKHTEFYQQSHIYLELNDAHSFIDQFKEQIASIGQCGYYFPPSLVTAEFKEFIDEAMEKIHTHCFGRQSQLSRKNRLDFIEIFYQLFILKWIDWINPGALSFTCKDAIDIGSAAGAGFFAFLRILANPSLFTKEEKDRLLWMIYSPGLMIRERAIDIQRLSRMVSYLAHLDTVLQSEQEALVEAFNKLYSPPYFLSSENRILV